MRIFRAEKQYGVTSGKWYFEFEAVTTGEMRVGWARPNVRADIELGSDELAYVFNGNRVSDVIQYIFSAFVHRVTYSNNLSTKPFQTFNHTSIYQNVRRLKRHILLR